MKKLLLIGRSGCGKTTLTQALRGEKVHYQKTQGMVFEDFLIDSPGEYAENHDLGAPSPFIPMRQTLLRC